MMNERKEQATFFERVLVEDPEYAKTVYENESIRFMLKLLLTAFIAVATLVFYIVQIGMTGFSFAWMSFIIAPLAYAMYNLYQAYINVKDAKEFMEACRMVHV